MSTPDWTVIERTQDANRLSDALGAASEHTEAEAYLRREFLVAAMSDSITEPAAFAPIFKDTRQRVDGYYVKRHPTLGEVLFESLDYETGPQFDEVFQILCEVARDGNEKAKALIGRMADKWASMNCEE